MTEVGQEHEEGVLLHPSLNWDACTCGKDDPVSVFQLTQLGWVSHWEHVAPGGMQAELSCRPNSAAGQGPSSDTAWGLSTRACAGDCHPRGCDSSPPGDSCRGGISRGHPHSWAGGCVWEGQSKDHPPSERAG